MRSSLEPWPRDDGAAVVAGALGAGAPCLDVLAADVGLEHLGHVLGDGVVDVDGGDGVARGLVEGYCRRASSVKT